MKQKNKNQLLILALVIVAIVFIGVLSLRSSKNPVERALAKEHDGTDAFYQQIIKSDGEWIENAGLPIFDNEVLATLPPKLAIDTPSQDLPAGRQVLGSHIAADGSEKWIEIDLSDLKLYAWEGNRKVYEFSVSTGRPGYGTPTGEYKVWRKVRSQAYKGGSRAREDYYYLPNVPYSLFFGGGDVPNWKGYAIHGTYWHNDFGIKNRSSGCVNLSIPNAEAIYNWAGPAIPDNVGAINTTNDNPGIRVVVHN